MKKRRILSIVLAALILIIGSVVLFYRAEPGGIAYDPLTGETIGTLQQLEYDWEGTELRSLSFVYQGREFSFQFTLLSHDSETGTWQYEAMNGDLYAAAFLPDASEGKDQVLSGIVRNLSTTMTQPSADWDQFGFLIARNRNQLKTNE